MALGPRQVRPGDAILLSGDVGRHGIALMTVREGIRLETALESDCAALARTVLRLFNADVPVHCLRDLTRELGVGTCCGKCLPEAKAALATSLKACDSSRHGLFSPTAATEFAV